MGMGINKWEIGGPGRASVPSGGPVRKGKCEDYFSNGLLLFVILFAVGVSFYFNAIDLKERVAYRGEGPQAYVNFMTKPENFEKDWNFQFSNAQDFMLATRSYLYFREKFGIDPGTLMYWQVGIQLMLIAFGCAVLSYILFGDRIVATLSGVFVLVSDIWSLNLSNHGPSLEIPAYSGIPIGLMIFAISFFLLNRYLVTFLLSALTAYFYMNLGGMLIMFILSYLFLRPRLLKEKGFCSGLILYTLLIVPYAYLIVSGSGVLMTDIPKERWVQLTRMFSFHWYPSTLAHFLIPHFVAPMVLVLVLFLLSLRGIAVKEDKHRKVFSGFVAVAVMSAAGILFAEVYPEPVIIRICLQKSSMLFSVVAFLYIINCSCKKIITGSPFAVFCGLITLLLPVFSKFGIALLPVALLWVSEIRLKTRAD